MNSDGSHLFRLVSQHCKLVAAAANMNIALVFLLFPHHIRVSCMDCNVWTAFYFYFLEICLETWMYNRKEKRKRGQSFRLCRSRQLGVEHRGHTTTEGRLWSNGYSHWFWGTFFCLTSRPGAVACQWCICWKMCTSLDRRSLLWFVGTARRRRRL